MVNWWNNIFASTKSEQEKLKETIDKIIAAAKCINEKADESARIWNMKNEQKVRKIAEYIDTIKKLNNEINRLRNQPASVDEKCQEELADLKAEYDTLKSQLANERMNWNDKNREYLELKKLYEEERKAIEAEMNGYKFDIERRRTSLLQTKEELEAKCQELTREVEKINKNKKRKLRSVERGNLDNSNDNNKDDDNDENDDEDDDEDEDRGAGPSNRRRRSRSQSSPDVRTVPFRTPRQITSPTAVGRNGDLELSDMETDPPLRQILPSLNGPNNMVNMRERPLPLDSYRENPSAPANSINMDANERGRSATAVQLIPDSITNIKNKTVAKEAMKVNEYGNLINSWKDNLSDTAINDYFKLVNEEDIANTTEDWKVNFQTSYIQRECVQNGKAALTNIRYLPHETLKNAGKCENIHDSNLVVTDDMIKAWNDRVNILKKLYDKGLDTYKKKSMYKSFLSRSINSSIWKTLTISEKAKYLAVLGYKEKTK